MMRQHYLIVRATWTKLTGQDFGGTVLVVSPGVYQGGWDVFRQDQPVRFRQAISVRG